MTQCLAAHTGEITSIATYPWDSSVHGPGLLLSTCDEGVVRMWDLRSHKPDVAYCNRLPSRETSECAWLSPHAAVVTCENHVSIMDWRSPNRPCASMAHSVDVTAVDRNGLVRYAADPLLFADEDGECIELHRTTLSRVDTLRRGVGRAVATGVCRAPFGIISVSMDGELDVHADDGSLTCKEVVGNAPTAAAATETVRSANPSLPECLDVCQTGDSTTKVLVARSDGTFVVLDCVEGKSLEVVLEAPGHMANSLVAAFFATPDVVATVATSGEAFAWSIAEDDDESTGLKCLFSFDLRADSPLDAFPAPSKKSKVSKAAVGPPSATAFAGVMNSDGTIHSMVVGDTRGRILVCRVEGPVT
jgi:hypothetical protein